MVVAQASTARREQSTPNASKDIVLLPWYTSVSYEPLHGPLLQQAFEVLLRKDATGGVACPFLHPPLTNLHQLFDFGLSQQQRSSTEAITQILKSLKKYSPKVAHPLYLEKDGAGLDPVGLIGDLLTTTMNTVVANYPFAPVLTLQEEEVTRGIRDLVGFPPGGDGTISADPAVSSIIAVNCAIHNKYKLQRDLGFSGMELPELVVIVSEFANPYWEQVCAVTGLGFNGLKRVKGDENGHLDVESLRSTIDSLKTKGKLPIMIVGTLGSDPHGAIDPLQEIADICREGGSWFHVDGTYGGPLIFHEEPFKSQKLGGLHRCDSFAMGCTGMLGIPYSSSILVTKQSDMLLSSVGLCKPTSYIFQENRLYDQRADNGDHNIQTARRGAVNSLWLMWQVRGRAGLGKHVQRAVDLAKTFYEEVKQRDNFEAICPQTTRVLFRYYPSQVGMVGGGISLRKIKMHLIRKGGACLGLATLGELNNNEECEWFAVSLANPLVTIENLRDVLYQIEDAAKEVYFGGSVTTGERADVKNVQGGMKNWDWDPSDLIGKALSLFQEKGIYFQSKRKEPVLQFRSPEQLRTELNLSLKDEPQLLTDSAIIDALDKIMSYSVHQAHPYYVYHVITGADPHALIADYFASTLTSSCESYETSPIYTLMETEVCLEARRILGFPKNGDGIFLQSGSLAVMTAFYTARATMFPVTISEGLQSFKRLKLVAFMSENAHYCIQKAALSQGSGFSSVVIVPVNDSGAMDVGKLKKGIQAAKDRGETPFYVQVTAGSTVLGRFDPIKDIFQVCREHGLWMHLDGTIGGGFMFSEGQLKSKLEHAQLADSMNFNFHKTLGLGQMGSLLLFRESGVLNKVFGVFNKAKAASGDGGGSTRNQSGISWGRRPDILKLWLSWKAKGTEGLGLHIDYTFSLKEFLLSELKTPERQKAFMLYRQEFDCPSVCFYYLPRALRELDRATEGFRAKLEAVGTLIQKRMFEIGIPIGLFRNRSCPQFLKIHVMSSGTTREDITYVLDTIDSTCIDIGTDSVISD